MSWLDDAQKIIAEKAKNATAGKAAGETRDALIRRMKLTYDNATDREIEKAVDAAFDTLPDLTDTSALNAFLRRRLEE